jgi:hypothetical protein
MLVEAMLHRFGGLNGFINEWSRCYNASPGGSGFRWRSLQAFLNLGILVDQQKQMMADALRRSRQDAYDLMSTEDLERARDESFLRLLRADPEIAVDGLRRLGYMVVAPEPGE